MAKTPILSYFSRFDGRKYAKYFFQPSFVGSSGKHGKNKLKYAKSARSNGMNPRKLSKPLFYAILDNFRLFWAQNIFFENPKTSLF